MNIVLALGSLIATQPPAALERVELAAAWDAWAPVALLSAALCAGITAAVLVSVHLRRRAATPVVRIPASL